MGESHPLFLMGASPGRPLVYCCWMAEDVLDWSPALYRGWESTSVLGSPRDVAIFRGLTGWQWHSRKVVGMVGIFQNKELS